jgi:thymidylate synthase
MEYRMDTTTVATGLDFSYLDNNGGNNNQVDQLGPIYGAQWRNFNGDEQTAGIDQLEQIINTLKDPDQRTSRRIILTAWNPCQIDQMALPPCHILAQFNVHSGNKLSCAMYQRSADSFLGLPFNIVSYSFLTHLLAHHCGLEAYECIFFLGNAHLYENAIDASEIQLQREPFTFPTLKIKQFRTNINDYQVEDFEINNYQSHEQIKVNMIA